MTFPRILHDQMNYRTKKRVQHLLHKRFAIQDVATAELLAEEIIQIVLQDSIEEIANFKKNEKAIRKLLKCIQEILEDD